MRIRDKRPEDQPAVERFLESRWGNTIVVGHGTRYDAARLPGILTTDNSEMSGLLTYAVGHDGLEVVSLDAVEKGRGIGTALLDEAKRRAKPTGRLWLITTNDNLDAIRFYQRRDLRIANVAPGAVNEARRIKPTIPEIGDYGIPIRDEITLEIILS
jgi:ribosomal protein S18 acetylase RimI-like enzyme